jgi:hypothetical protein
MKRIADWYRRRRSGPRATTKLFMKGRDLFAALRVSETDVGTRRWDVALELFREGKRMVFEDVGFHFERPNVLVVTAVSPDAHATLAKVNEKFERALSCLEMLGAEDERFRELVAGRRVKLELIYDYGMGSVLLAEREGENLGGPAGAGR